MTPDPEQAPTDQLARDLATRRARLRAAIDAAPAAHREVRPASDRWSVAEVVEHLAFVEAAVVRLLGSRMKDLPAAAKAGHSAAPRLDAARVLDRAQRIASRANVQPRGGVEIEPSWTALGASRAALLDLVLRAGGRDVSSLTAPHPSFGPLDFWQWVEFVGLHEARHAEQIRETEAALAQR